MGCALAPVVVASLLELATFDANLGLRIDAQSTTISQPDAPSSARTSASATPSVAAVVDGGGQRLTATYMPRLWTNDVEAQPSPSVMHRAEARLETTAERSERRWTVTAAASAARGTTEPLVDPLRAQLPGAGGGQIPTTQPFQYEELWLDLGGGLRVDPRTSVSAHGGWSVSNSTGPDTALLPPQRLALAGASVSRELTERDTLRVDLRAEASLTGNVAGTRTGFGDAVGTWRRRFTPLVEGWLSAGGRVLYWGAPDTGRLSGVEPTGEVGLSRTSEQLSFLASLRETMFVDRYSGSASPAVDALGSVTYHPRRRLTIVGTAMASARTDGRTALGRADLRATWTVGESLSFDVGALATWQRELQPGRPTFFDAGGFVAVGWSRIGVFGRRVAANEP